MTEIKEVKGESNLWRPSTDFPRGTVIQQKGYEHRYLIISDANNRDRKLVHLYKEDAFGYCMEHPDLRFREIKSTLTLEI